MENTEKGYTMRIKIGDNELSISGVDEGFIRDMIAEFKEPFFGAIARRREPVPVMVAQEPEAAKPRAKKAEAGPESGAKSFMKGFRVRTGVDVMLVYLYYMKEQGGGRGVRPKHIAAGLKAAGVATPKALSTNLGYMKRQGLVTMENRLWSITDKGVDKVKKIMLK